MSATTINALYDEMVEWRNRATLAEQRLAEMAKHRDEWRSFGLDYCKRYYESRADYSSYQLCKRPADRLDWEGEEVG